MKKILITGANSYIGTSFEKYIKENFSCDYQVDTVDMIDGSWKEKDFSQYDSIFHVAAIVHKKEKKIPQDLYFKVNRDLAIEVAKKAKSEGVNQFVFLSTMGVYGRNTGKITLETNPTPKTNYAKSKYEAEKILNDLNCSSFKVCIVRPPMVYGKNCKGNYNSIVNLVKRFPFFPRVNNRRSMIHIDNLIEFIRLSIDNIYSGLFFPQNKKYICTSKLAKKVSNELGKKIYLSYLLGIFVYVLYPFSSIIKKAFGSYVYVDTEKNNYDYCIRNEDYE